MSERVLLIGDTGPNDPHIRPGTLPFRLISGA
jgi:hypothetical protein